ncbi:MAG: 2-oxoacid:acceptor oxidoreductase subunit alpha [Rhodospirillaceae bacterium]|jgi:2-oxoglutarate/2-oxoacid ferredoxin oxidoreductase subunit alpha|nr:2-oxoacid:acceptor oxidoreductase subunit alpha [Rhodospirillaceae bacterium]MBT6405875.1 2-oxoacid:acceptor oxidoreductase subunit alpha [Rhodospirillaceae bacterium]MBT6536531.1 2-oxoacid:acceptor oxidoreductase subunit alpha [Rhodospirillaceae bacterium]MBT7361034.1 2-oxoacid:acceptor oxidoreductase subunit alpha [Rhodospirillaceae bacterium]
MSEVAAVERPEENRQEVESAVVRFAGDSGDGMQLTGSHFTMTAAIAGNDLATFPDFPAEIRAPAGTTFGVSAFQINFGARKIMTSGDLLDVLVVMNPAALVTNLADVKPNGIVIADSGAFTARNLTKAGYEENPLEDSSLDGYRLVKIDMSRLTVEAVKEFGLSNKEALRSKNMWALGVVYWMYGRKRQASIDWLETKFAKNPDIAKANIAALNAGHAFGETAEMPAELGTYEVESATIEPGLYRTITGAESVSLGLLAGSLLADLKIAFCSYPITPASALLHQLARMKEFGVVTFQAEDEIAAAAAAIGASYAGSLGITSSSGPGIALKMEAIGLAIATELPLVVINSQRAGPSTGLPTKTEQSDLYQAVYGRNGDAPMPVISVSTPSDGYEVAIEAVRIATKYMTPVMVLTDGYITNASEPWLIPDAGDSERFDVEFRTDPENFQPFMRDDETLARPWVKPGTPDLMHRIGGIERSYDSGHISYDPENHQKMTDVRAAKVLGIANDIPEQTVEVGEAGAKLGVVGWGSTYGPINRAVNNMRDDGLDVAQIHLRYIWPLPRNLGELLGTFDQILVPEMNTGQLRTLLRDQYLLPAEGFNKVNGKPFLIGELEDAIRARLEK